MKLRTIILGAVLVSGCLDSDDASTVATTEQNSITQIGYIPQNGTTVAFDDITATGLNLQNVADITACDEKALYATVKVYSTYELYFSNDSGQSWIDVGANAGGAHIACDHSNLATLDASGQLFWVRLSANGQLGRGANGYVQWFYTAGLAMARIQGGDGTFYGIRVNAAGNDVYTTSTRSLGSPKLVWSNSPIARIGAIQVTGTGTTSTGLDNMAVGDSIAWPRAAFALEASGTVDTNNQLLSGINSWGTLNTGGERYTSITAASSNVLFGLENKSDGVHLGRIRITETNCFDGVDNDHNGLTDSEDPACIQAVANNFCTSIWRDGDFCSSQYQPSLFLGQPNQHTSLTHCNGGVATVTPGVCIAGTSTGHDYLRTQEGSVQPEMPNEGHYCNVHWPDGSWDFDWTGVTPCQTIFARHPTQTPNVVRAGQYSPTGANNVYVRCTDGYIAPGTANGIAPLVNAYNTVGHGTNKCIFQVSPTQLPMFDRMVVSQLPTSVNTVQPFVHNHSPVDTLQFNPPFPQPPLNPPPTLNPDGTLAANGVDTTGASVGQREPAYDVQIDEGQPLFAPATGTVLLSGSRIRDVRTAGGASLGTPNQGELYVLYEVGSDRTYRESFVVYYAHVRRRLVVDGQTVKSGQILGYVGATGTTSGFAHTHVGVIRSSNTNAHTPTVPNLGWHQSIIPNNDLSGLSNGGQSSTDPLGWNNSYSFDPWGYWDFDTDTGRGYNGIGAWSPALFKPGAAFHYP
jgi:hypothetical protein